MGWGGMGPVVVGKEVKHRIETVLSLVIESTVKILMLVNNSDILNFQD